MASADPAETEPLVQAEETGDEERRRTTAAPPRRTTIWDGFEDADDTAGLLDEDEAAGYPETIFKPDVEAEHLDGASPMDPRVIMKQVGLCALLISITVYEGVFKKKAIELAKLNSTMGFDMGSLGIMQAIVSLPLGGILIFVYKEQATFMKDLPMQIVRYAPVGILFGAAAYVQMLAMAYLDADVFKVLEQTRLLVLGIFGYFMLKKRLSISSWVALIAITLCCLTYGRMKGVMGTQAKLGQQVTGAVQLSTSVSDYFVAAATPETPEATEEVADLEVKAVEVKAKDEALVDLGSIEDYMLTNTDTVLAVDPAGQPEIEAQEARRRPVGVLREAGHVLPETRVVRSRELAAPPAAALLEAQDAPEDAAKLKEVLGKMGTLLGGGGSAGSNAAIGFALTAVFVLLACTASTYSEIVLKRDKHIPYYIQKIYQELSAGIFTVFLSAVIAPVLVKNDIAKKNLEKTFVTEGDLFFGWTENYYVIVLFIFMLAKAWLSGLIVKQLSAIAKQLCSIVAVTVLYFFMLIHDCSGVAVDKTNPPFSCPENFSNAVSFNVIIVDFAVLCSVVSYTTALRDKQRKNMYKKKIGELEALGDK